MRRAPLTLSCLMLAMSGVSARAAAQAPDQHRLEVSGSSECPSPEAVKSAIFQLTSRARRNALRSVATVFLSDEGDRYRVDVTGESTAAARTYTDASRDCDRRARFAAVFAVLTLMPPELAPEPEPTPPPEPKKPVAPPHARALPGSRVRSSFGVELTAVADRAVGVTQDVPSFGGELRLLLGPAPLRGLLTLGYLPRVDVGQGAFEYVLRRVPASAGLRAELAVGGADLGFDLGLAAALVRSQGLNLVRPSSDQAWLVGLRAGASLSVPLLGAVGPTLGAHAFVWPSPSELEATPRGTVGRLPRAWVGVSLGLALGL